MARSLARRRWWRGAPEKRDDEVRVVVRRIQVVRTEVENVATAGTQRPNQFGLERKAAVISSDADLGRHADGARTGKSSCPLPVLVDETDVASLCKNCTGPSVGLALCRGVVPDEPPVGRIALAPPALSHFDNASHRRWDWAHLSGIGSAIAALLRHDHHRVL